MPTLLISAEEPVWAEERRQEWQDFSAHSKHVDILATENTHHQDFTMRAMLYWLLGKPHLYVGTLKAHSVASQAMVQFMHSVIKK